MHHTQKTGLGSVLATLGGLGIILSIVLGWTGTASPWGFILGFIFGLLAGMGAALSIVGLVGRQRAR